MIDVVATHESDSIQRHLLLHRYTRFLKTAPFDGDIRNRRDRGFKERICRWCGKAIDRRTGRRKWCSQACVGEFLLRSHAGVARQRVFKRDRGICAACGANTMANARRFQVELRPLLRDAQVFYVLFGVCRAKEFARDLSVITKCYMPQLYYRKTKSKSYRRTIPRCDCPGCRPRVATTWEADHITPVCEGGGCCGLENYRTLCSECHKRETIKLATRRKNRLIDGLVDRCSGVDQ